MQQQIYYELSVLSKAVQFKNLSGAALHVGLSQPQLSRIIHKIEEELKIVLLDRNAKRKSGWTSIAFQLALLYEKSFKTLEQELNNISQNQMAAEIHIGTLEGLSHFAVDACKFCFDQIGVKKIFIETYDLNDLEAHFLSGHLDLIFTSKTPGRQKFKYLTELGFQILEKIQTNKNYAVASSFEYGKASDKEFEMNQHILVSNSLAIRKNWLTQFGGIGFLPTEAKKGKNKEHEPIFMIGADILNPSIWAEINSYFLKNK